MEKIICGSVTLYREICPNCEEANLSGSNNFQCNCGEKYFNNEVKNVRMEAAQKRQNLIKYAFPLSVIQNNRCYWCNNKFSMQILRKTGKDKHVVVKLSIHVDHKIPYAFTQNNDYDNLCASCSICNRWKHDKIFESEDECRKYLNYKWMKALDNKEIEIIT